MFMLISLKIWIGPNLTLQNQLVRWGVYKL